VQFADKVWDKRVGPPPNPVVKSACCSHDGMILEHPTDRAWARRFSSDPDLSAVFEWPGVGALLLRSSS
jgi:hypothetical protein